jgi:hypothetical protein
MEAAVTRLGFLASALGEHVEVGCLLAGQRSAAARAAHVDLAGLTRLDERIDAQIDALRLAGEDGYGAARRALKRGLPGSLFLLAVLAVEQGRHEHASQLACAALGTERGFRDLGEALGWVSPGRIEAFSSAFDARPALADRAAAALGRHAHRLSTSPALPALRALSEDGSPRLRALACEALGAAAGAFEAAWLAAAARDPEPQVRLAALWAAARKAPSLVRVDAFVRIAHEAPALAEKALDRAARLGSAAEAEALLSSLPPGEAGVRAGICAVAAAGRPAMVPWLFPHLAEAATARLAGWAYATVTGRDLLDHGLSRPAPDPGQDRIEGPPDARVELLARGAVSAAAAGSGSRVLLLCAGGSAGAGRAARRRAGAAHGVRTRGNVGIPAAARRARDRDAV